MYRLRDPLTSDELHLYRIAHRVTLVELAAALGISRQRAWQLEAMPNPSADRCERFAAGVRAAAKVKAA